jgi:hypothetical protein
VDKPKWLEANNSAFQTLWEQYRVAPRVVRLPRIVLNDIDDAIDSLIDLETSAATMPAKLDEYKRWERCEPRAEKGTEAANNPIKY